MAKTVNDKYSKLINISRNGLCFEKRTWENRNSGFVGTSIPFSINNKKKVKIKKTKNKPSINYFKLFQANIKIQKLKF